MKQSASLLDASLRKLLTRQALISMVAIIVFALLKNLAEALSAAFGATSAILMALLLGLRIRNLDRRLKQNRTVSAGITLVGVALRLLSVSFLFWLGIFVLDLAPLPMIITFALAQLGYLLNVTALKN